MQKHNKVLLVSLCALAAAVVVAAWTVPALLKPKISALLKDEFHKSVNADVSFGDIDISIIKNFPSLSLSVRNLNIVGREEFAGTPLFATKALHVGVDVIAYLKHDQVQIDWIIVDQPNIKIQVNKKGQANYDIVKASTPSQESKKPLQITLKRLQIRNANLEYRTPDANANIQNLNLEAKAKVSDAQQDVALNVKADKISAGAKGVQYFNNVRTALDLDASYEKAQKKTEIRKLELALNELKISGDGSVVQTEAGYDVDLRFASGDNTPLLSVLSLIPSAYAGDLKTVDASGFFSLDGEIKGKYSAEGDLPMFKLQALIQNGKFKYAKLPLAITHIELDAKVDHPQGPLNDLNVDVTKYSFHAGSSYATGNVSASKPVSGPAVDLNLRSHLDLEELSKAYPLEDASIRRGVMDTDIAMESFGTKVQALTGKISARDVVYEAKGGKPLQISAAELALKPSETAVQTLRIKTGQSDALLSGTLSPLPLLLALNQPIKADLSLTSDRIDVADFSSDDSKKSTPENTQLIPANLDATLRAAIKEINYDKVRVSNVVGKLRIKDQTLHFDGVKADGLGGKLALDGSVATPKDKPASYDVKYAIKNAAFDQAFSQLNMIQSFAPIAKFIDGRFSTSAKLSGNLDQALAPDLKSLRANGFLQTTASKLSGFKPLSMLSSAVPVIPKTLDLTSIFAPFSIQEGALMVKEFPLRVKDISMRISGTTGLDQAMDFVVKTDLPGKYLKGSSFASKLGGAGIDLESLASIPVAIDIKGSITDPKLGFNVDSAGLKSSLKQTALNQLAPVTEKASKLLAEAQAQGDELREKAQAAADKLRAEGDVQADKLEAQGGSNPLKKIAAKEAAKALRKETNKKAQNLIDEANKQADALVQKAQSGVDSATPAPPSESGKPAN